MRLVLLMMLSGACALSAADRKPSPQGLAMDYGPVIHYFLKLNKPQEQDVCKGVFIKLDQDAGVLFDTETLRYATAWSGGWLNMGTTNIARYAQGQGGPDIVGTRLWGTDVGPGVAGPDGSWKDTRKAKLGNLPSTWGQYRGLYRYDDKVVLSYDVGTTAIREVPQAFEANGTIWFSRTFEIAASDKPIAILMTQASGDVTLTKDARRAQISGALTDQHQTIVAVQQAPDNVKLRHDADRVWMEVAAQKTTMTCSVAIASLPAKADKDIDAALAALPKISSVDALCKGATMSEPTVTTTGARGDDKWAYVVDTIELPLENPWKSWLRPISMDFFPDGRLALATMAGEVWIASGIDDALKKVTWQRHATGLFEPMGMKIIDNKVVVLCRDQLARLDDLNNDGIADHYVSLNRDAPMDPIYNDFAFDLVRDRAGNYYYARGGHGAPVGMPLHGALVRIGADGKKSEVIATGLRTPSGIGIGPNDEITAADNQGHWTPACRINLIEPGKWYGYVGNPSRYKKSGEPKHPEKYDDPICWMPMVADNCPGSQVWSSATWGPLSNMCFHLSYGQSSMLAVLMEKVGKQTQGGVVTLPFRFASGAFRGAVNPRDGQFYVSGLKGWQTNATVDGCLQRVRYTSKPAHFPVDLQVKSDRILITFSDPLDPDTVEADSVGVQRWNYLWSAKYGSSDYSVADPKKKKRDSLAVQSASLSKDGKTVTLMIKDLKPVDQMGITVKFATPDGDLVKHTIYHTINVLGK